MPVQAVFGLSVLLSFVASGVVAKLYCVPKLRMKRREDALLPLVVPRGYWSQDEYRAPTGSEVRLQGDDPNRGVHYRG